jgi:hypothetical protein
VDLDREREQREREERENEAMRQRDAVDNAVIGNAARIETCLKRTGDWHNIAEFGDNVEPAIKELERYGRIERDGDRIRAKVPPDPRQ